MKLYCTDCLAGMTRLPDNSVDAIVTDPPAGISFMSKKWDHHRGGRDQWVAWLSEVMVEALRVLKPGGHALVWAIPRTSHWTGWALEDAGFEVRDRIAHLFGSGFPKSHDISKAIDREAGAKREKTIWIDIYHDGWTRRELGYSNSNGVVKYTPGQNGNSKTLPATPEAAQWSGWGTALKPACEDWWLCRKPLSERTIAQNVLRWGTGGINVDGGKVGTSKDMNPRDFDDRRRTSAKFSKIYRHAELRRGTGNVPNGRWPANVTHDGSPEVLAGFPVTKSGGRDGPSSANENRIFKLHGGPCMSSEGSAARFFYCAKASKKERNIGGVNNRHPTVKSLSLMRYLVRLITPPGGTVLDPFMGSGTTGMACVHEGFEFIGYEKDRESFEIAKRRIAAVKPQKELTLA